MTVLRSILVLCATVLGGNPINLNAYGNSVEHYGAIDTDLTKFGHDQTGSIKQFLG